MNLGGKQGLDALLKDWPPPSLGGAGDGQDDERIWDERADATVKAALEKKDASGDLDALLAAPALPPEAGESASGEKKIAGESSMPPTPSIAPAGGERRRTSLKEIAARASQAGRPSSPGHAPGAPPSIAPSRPSVAPSRPSIPTPLPSGTPLPRPSEAGKDDSGVINLSVVQASATAQQKADAEKAQPGQAGLFDDEKTVESPVDPVEQQAIPARAPSVAVISPKEKKGNAGAVAGIAIAVLGIAAAFAIVARKPPASAPVASDTRAAVAAGAKVAIPPPAPSTTPAPAFTAQATAVAEATPPSAPAEPSKAPVAEPGRVAVAPSQAGVPNPSKEAPESAKTAVAAAPGRPGDLQSEMERAVGPVKDPGATAPTPEPASGRPSNQNIPEQPSQGSVQAAIGAVIGGAKACVAGADDVSRAQVTFSSNGTVIRVSVSGWAASHGKSACVQAALKGAHVGPFSKTSYDVGVPIRP